ncbi:RHS repeat-associated core domain-containing protein, partial [Lonsdalea quercina]
AGQLRDSESGLCYNRFRYYDPAGGGYISPDPIGLAGGINLYAYAPNPLKWIDPLGLTGCSITRGSDVTPEVVQNALKGDPMQTVQGTVSLPAVQRYVDRLLKGDIAPPIKVDGNVIVEGNHRYVAGKVVGILPEQVPGALSPSNVPRIKPISETVVDLFDWGNH